MTTESEQKPDETATGKAKTAKKAAKKTATKTAAAPAAPVAPAAAQPAAPTRAIRAAAPPKRAVIQETINAQPSDEDIDREIRAMDLLLKRMQLKQVAQQVQQFEVSEAEKIRKRESAQRSLREEARGKRATAAQCEHRLGGFGLEDTYSGDDRPAIVVMDLPIAGMRKAFCVRCPKEWATPDPRLKASDPDTYIDQAMEWKECMKLIKQSRGKAMGGPTFAFEKEDGTPVHPTLI